MPGSTPPTSQLDWLSSTTAMIVLFWSRATRDLLKSFGWGIAALHRLMQRRSCHFPGRPPHSIFQFSVAKPRSVRPAVMGGRAGCSDTGANLWGTEGSNPSLSSGESIANPTFSIRTNPVSGFAVDRRLALALEGSRGRVQHWRRCRGPPSDGVAGAGRGGRDRGCRGGDPHGAGEGYPQAIRPAAGNARPARRYSWHTRQMSDRMQCLEIAITPGGNDGQGSRCRLFSLDRRGWRRPRT